METLIKLLNTRKKEETRRALDALFSRYHRNPPVLVFGPCLDQKPGRDLARATPTHIYLCDRVRSERFARTRPKEPVGELADAAHASHYAVVALHEAAHVLFGRDEQATVAQTMRWLQEAIKGE